MLWEDTPAPRETAPPRPDAEGPLYEYEDGNGMWISTGVSRRSARLFRQWCISQDHRTEDVPLIDTPIYSALIFRVSSTLLADLDGVRPGE